MAERYGARYGRSPCCTGRRARPGWPSWWRPRAHRPGLDTAPTTLAGVRQMLRRCAAARPWACCPTRCRPRAWACGRRFSAAPAYTMTLAGAAGAADRRHACCWSGASGCRAGRGYRLHFAAWRGALAAATWPQAALQINARDGATGARLPAAVPVGLRALQAAAQGDRGRYEDCKSSAACGFMRVLAPAAAGRGPRARLGLGCVLYVLAVPRRRVVQHQPGLCFPEQTRRRAARAGARDLHLCGAGLAGPQLAVACATAR